MTHHGSRLSARRIAVFLAGVAAFLDMYCTQALLPELQAHFNAGTAEVGMTVSASTLAVALLAPLVGALADRWGRKRVIVAGAMLLALPTVLLAFAPNMPIFLALRFAQGVCVPAIITVTMAYIGEEWSPRHLPEVVGLYAAGTGIGGIMGRITVAITTEYWGWQEAFILLGVLNLLVGALIWTLLPPANRFVPSGSLRETLLGFVDHLTNRVLLATCGVGFSALFAMVAAFTYVSFYLSLPPFSLSVAALGWIFLVYLLGIVMAPWSGRMTARFGPVRGIQLAVGSSLTGLGLTLVPSLWVVILGLALVSVGIFVSQTVSMSVINASVRSGRSSAVGLYTTCYYIGGSVGAVLPAVVWNSTGPLGGWLGCVLMIGVVQLIPIILALWVWRPFWQSRKI